MFQVATSYWLMNGFGGENDGATQSEYYGTELGEIANPPHTSERKVEMDFSGGRGGQTSI